MISMALLMVADKKAGGAAFARTSIVIMAIVLVVIAHNTSEGIAWYAWDACWIKLMTCTTPQLTLSL